MIIFLIGGIVLVAFLFLLLGAYVHLINSVHPKD